MQGEVFWYDLLSISPLQHWDMRSVITKSVVPKHNRTCDIDILLLYKLVHKDREVKTFSSILIYEKEKLFDFKKKIMSCNSVAFHAILIKIKILFYIWPNTIALHLIPRYDLILLYLTNWAIKSNKMDPIYLGFKGIHADTKLFFTCGFKPI
jgi:hypothetical protein